MTNRQHGRLFVGPIIAVLGCTAVAFTSMGCKSDAGTASSKSEPGHAGGLAGNQAPASPGEENRVLPVAAQSLPTPKSSDGVIVRLKVNNLRNPEGVVRIAVFEAGGGFPNREQAMRKVKIPAAEAAETIQLEPLPMGTYAFAVYHDVNNDGEMNRSNIGIPTEPYGFSNNARGQFGPPSFSQAAIRLEAQQQDISVTVQ